MHTGCDDTNPIKDGDNWLRANVPLILNSKQYREGGALFIVFDEARYGDGPIPMIVMSPRSRASEMTFTTRMLRTVEEIFSLPLLRNANQEPTSAIYLPSFQMWANTGAEEARSGGAPICGLAGNGTKVFVFFFAPRDLVLRFTQTAPLKPKNMNGCGLKCFHQTGEYTWQMIVPAL